MLFVCCVVLVRGNDLGLGNGIVREMLLRGCNGL